MKFFRILKDIIRFQSLPKDQRRIVFYSEGKNYWPYLKDLVEGVVISGVAKVCYVTSDLNDPGLKLAHANIEFFYVDSGYFRNWFFANLSSGVVVMTMPDLHQFQVKRQFNIDLHYVYVQHSLVSLHMIYREGAFDYFDTVFCSGPHHVRELRAMEKLRGLQSKNLVEHGYPLLDNLLSSSGCLDDSNADPARKHILVAPSWGSNAVIESGVGEELVAKLIEAGFQVTLRPHPETIKHAPRAIERIVNNHRDSKLFVTENNITSQSSLFDSDIMICDWSGVALEYAFGLNKPVIFLDVPRKVNNPNFADVEIEPFEISIREKIGAIATLDNILEKIDSTEMDSSLYKDFIFNMGVSTRVGVDAILEIAAKLEESK